MNFPDIVDFIFELNQLKREPHRGVTLAGVSHPDTVAEHVLRTVQIGLILAEMEGVDPIKVALMCLVHDNAEARIGDHNKVAARYIDKRAGEQQAYQEQSALLPPKLKKKYMELFHEFTERKTPEAIVAKDADWLETAFQCREYEEIGFVKMKNWIENVGKALKTKGAKKLFTAMRKKSFCDWWKHLKKLDYSKL